VASSIDDLLSEITSLSMRLSELGEDHPDRAKLERQREELRGEARAISDTLRHPLSVRSEIAMLEARLVELSELRIGSGYSEKHLGRTIQDPGAYRHAINARIDEEHASEVEAINERLAHLRSLASEEEA